MAPLGVHTGFDRDLLACDEPGLRRFAKLCVRTGVTTAADLANLLPEEAVEMMLRVTGEPDYPARIVSLRRFYGLTPEELIDRALELRGRSRGQASPRHHQGGGGRLDPGLLRPAALARLL